MTRLSIDTDYLLNFLEKILRVPSPTGYTDELVRLCSAELDRLEVPFELTRRGAIRSRIKGTKSKPARAVISHLDTLGAQVKELKENGRLKLTPIGHWSARFAEGARCTIFSAAGTYRGTILPLKASGHTYNEEVDSQPVGWDFVELRVDAFAETKDQLRRLQIDIGDFIALDPGFEVLNNGFINSRYLDNKAGVSVMFAALEALSREGLAPPVDTMFLFSISEEVGIGASSVLTHDVASLITVDNGTTAPGQNSREFGVTIAMADQTGPFDYHLTKKLERLCQENEIRYQKDIFKYYRSDSAAALEAGADVRTSLITFGIDGSHGYERIHIHSLRSLAELITAYVLSTVEIKRDEKELGSVKGFTKQPRQEAEQDLPSPREIDADLESS